MKVLVGSKNLSKIDGAKFAFENFFDNVEILGVDALSGVSSQPVGMETLTGARNRIKDVKQYANANNMYADFFVAIESGLVQIFDNYFIMDFAVIENNEGKESIGITCSFPVPKKLVNEIKTRGLGSVIDELFGSTKGRNVAGGISGLTHNAINRTTKTKDAFIMALTKFVNENWCD